MFHRGPNDCIHCNDDLFDEQIAKTIASCMTTWFDGAVDQQQWVDWQRHQSMHGANSSRVWALENEKVRRFRIIWVKTKSISNYMGKNQAYFENQIIFFCENTYERYDPCRPENWS